MTKKILSLVLLLGLSLPALGMESAKKQKPAEPSAPWIPNEIFRDNIFSCLEQKDLFKTLAPVNKRFNELVKSFYEVTNDAVPKIQLPNFFNPENAIAFIKQLGKKVSITFCPQMLHIEPSIWMDKSERVLQQCADQVVSLTLSVEDFNYISAKLLASLKNLKTLIIHRNRFQKENPALQVSSLPKQIKKLICREVEFFWDMNAKHLENMKSLERLELQRCHGYGKKFFHFSKIPNLSDFVLRDELEENIRDMEERGIFKCFDDRGIRAIVVQSDPTEQGIPIF